MEIRQQQSRKNPARLRQNIGYIDMSAGFNYTTSEELTVALNDLRAQGMNGLILDLRDNPGGILEQSVRVAEKFIPKGEVIVSQRGRFSIDNRTWKSANNNPEKIPLVCGKISVILICQPVSITRRAKN